MAWNSNAKNFLRQTRYLANMAYLRCKNLTLGYTLPNDIVKKICLQSFRIYFSAENLFEFDSLNLPIDPETTTYRSDFKKEASWSFGRSYPFSRTLSFGVQAVF